MPMASDVLVLNRSFYAIQVISWRRALSLVYLDHAHVVDEDALALPVRAEHLGERLKTGANFQK